MLYFHIMSDKAFHTLEYDKILEQLTEHACTNAGRQMCRELVPWRTIEEVNKALDETTDAEARVITCGSTSFYGVKDIGTCVKRLEVGSSLGIGELLSISSLLDAAAGAISYGNRREGDEPDSLTGMFASLDAIPGLNSEIKRCIISEEEIADDASSALKQIRRKIKGIDSQVHNALNAVLLSAKLYLQDAVITMRDGRYCVPVKTEYKGNVAGLIHGGSGSGKAVFVEPSAVVELNNSLRELEIEEQKEIERILARLSSEAAPYTHELMLNYRVLVQLDFIFAKALLSRSYHGTRPIFNTDRRINLKKARHPLLRKGKEVVANDIMLGDDFDLLIITGPNTGGKTVTLKTIGLLSIMGQAGLHIPALDHSELGIFSKVYADIGDEQSIEQSLSTFSAHMTNIVNIMAEADENSLCLFDELGAGTDPIEGAALAKAILSRLHSRGIRTAATTHYSELKVYALSAPGVENACCEFDVTTLAPTYRLLIGVPGKSNAFAISSKLGLGEDIIDEAKEEIGEKDEAFEDVISNLEERRIKLERAESEASSLRDEIKALHDNLESSKAKLEAERAEIIRIAREEARDILANAKKGVDNAIRSMNKAGVTVGKDVEQIRSGLRESIDELNESLAIKAKRESGLKPSDLHLGDSIHIISLDLNGTVNSAIDEKGDFFASVGIMRTKVNIKDVELGPELEIADSKRVSGAGAIGRAKSMSIASEINLVGLRVDEAMPELDKYLDDAYIAHLKSVRIIHGRGTGALKSAVQTMLRKNKRIKSYRTGEYGEGGYGVTVAEFKEE